MALVSEFELPRFDAVTEATPATESRRDDVSDAVCLAAPVGRGGLALTDASAAGGTGVCPFAGAVTYLGFDLAASLLLLRGLDSRRVVCCCCRATGCRAIEFCLGLPTLAAGCRGEDSVDAEDPA